MKTPFLIIVHGAPGTGKTILARRLAQDLRLPLISKDDIKEILFDILGWQDRAWSQKLGHASSELLFHLLEGQFQAGASLIVETAFIPQFHTPRFLELKAQYEVESCQIFCKTEEQTLVERFMQRARSAERHPGHVDHLITETQVREILQGDRYGLLEIGGVVFELDTTNFSRVDYETLLEAIKIARD